MPPPVISTATFAAATSTQCMLVLQGTECPDANFMCNDPGLLTCLGDLNDCSGKGDCLKGNCYCHSGWGGADCSVSACISHIGCADVRSARWPIHIRTVSTYTASDEASVCYLPEPCMPLCYGADTHGMLLSATPFRHSCICLQCENAWTDELWLEA